MKITLLKTVLLVTFIFAGVLSTNLNAQDKFFTNEEVKDELVVSKIIYRHDGMLYRHMKYNYSYDDQGRMVTKETFKWDDGRNEWTPYCKLDYTYTHDKIVLELCKWNNKKNEYNHPKERNVYELNEENLPVASINYKWDLHSKDWKINNNIIFYQNIHLLAIGY